MTNGKKKRMGDIDSILGSAQRAEQVVRPTTAPPPEPEPPKVERKNIQVDGDLHTRLKTYASGQKAKVQDLADEAIRAYLVSKGAL